MDFELDKSQKEIQKAAMEFAKGEFDKDLCLDLEKNREFPKDIFEKAGELGFIGMHFPEKYSGQDLGLFENTLVFEEFCKKDSTVGAALALASYASECVLKFGNDDLKEKYLPKVAEGKMISACAFMEQGRGSDLSVLGTTAVKEGDEWVINGEKSYVVNGGSAGFYIVLCQTDSDAKPTKGISMFVVDADASGLTATDIGDKLGLRMTKSSDLTLKDVRVPSGNLLGKEGKGYKQAQEYYDISRVVIASMAIGMAQGAFERTLDYTKERVQFNRKIVQFPITQHKIADMATGIQASRLLTYQAAMNYDKGNVDPALTGMAKMT
ncbi:MAG: acyl-CoA/acyl-ACP dehydrogenase, partial [Desulfobacterales bacterium]|nr:acyl-CoA/acyl-ACP dehydrogenase [Desulfobacterales bacterium]